MSAFCARFEKVTQKRQISDCEGFVHGSERRKGWLALLSPLL